ncbi:MAG: hypothetical protein ACLUEQ_12395 [Cloacibacillus evryensis]
MTISDCARFEAARHQVFRLFLIYFAYRRLVRHFEVLWRASSSGIAWIIPGLRAAGRCIQGALTLAFADQVARA